MRYREGFRVSEVPSGFGDAGRELWEAIRAEVPDGFELDARETEYLRRAAEIADLLEGLDEVIRREGMMVDEA